MNNGIKIALIIIVLGVIVGGGVAYYLYNKPHQEVIETKPFATYKAADLVDELARDTATLKQKINGQVIQVNGKVRVVSTIGNGIPVILMEAGNYGLNDVSLQMDTGYMDGVLTLPEGKDISVKGIYTGHQYDDDIESWTVYLNRCVLVK